MNKSGLVGKSARFEQPSFEHIEIMIHISAPLTTDAKLSFYLNFL